MVKGENTYKVLYVPHGLWMLTKSECNWYGKGSTFGMRKLHHCHRCGCVHGYAFFTMTAPLDATGHDTAWREYSSGESDSELVSELVELATAS